MVKDDENMSTLDGVYGPNICLTEEQCQIIQCSEKSQLICGAPGTGKTTVLLFKALLAAKEEKPGRVVVETWQDFEPRVKRFMNSYTVDLKRTIVFGFDEPLTEEDDVFCDDMGLNDLQFLLIKAEKQQSGQTVIVVTGSINRGVCEQQLAHIWEAISCTRANCSYTKHTLTTILRCPKYIASFWMNELEILNSIANDSDGEPVVHKKFLLVSQVLEQVAETLRNLLFVKKVARRSIAIIGPRKTEVRQLLNYLKPLFPGNEEDEDRLRFRSAKQYAEGENIVTVDEFSAAISQEWTVVIAFSLICADFNENFRVIASSRATSCLFFFERDYFEIQNSISQVLDPQSKNNLEHSAMKKLLNNGIKRIGSSGNVKEFDVQAICFHQFLTALKEDYVAGAGVYVENFEDCDTFSKCLQYLMRDENKLRSFVFALKATEEMIGGMKYRIQWSYERKPKLIVLEHHKFFERALQIEDHSELGKVYLEFCSHWCRVVMEFYKERANRTYKKPALFGTKNNPDCERLVNIANMLVKCRCALRFDHS